MYKEFYNIKTDPFHTHPSPAIFYDSGIHQEAWEYLARGITYREPFLLLTGDHGTGKTLLCLKLAQELQQKKILPCAYIPVPTCSYANILKEIAQSLNIEVNEHDEAAIQYAIFQKLRSLGRESELYIIIDDVQDMELPTLKKLLLLSNYNYHGIFPIMFVFFAHTVFVEQLESSSLIALDYRIKQRFHLSCLDIYETKEYIYFRLLKAEAPGVPVFTDDAIKKIFAFCNGIPQLINKICDACLILGSSQRNKIIEASLVAEANKIIEKEQHEIKTESKVTLVQEAQIIPLPSEKSPTVTQDKVQDTSKQIPALLSILNAILIISLSALLITLCITNYLQYRFIAGLKNVSLEVKPVSEPSQSKKSPEVTTVTVSETPAVIKQADALDSSSTTSLPYAIPKNVVPEKPPSPSKEGNTVPAVPEQHNTSIYSEQKENTSSTIVSKTVVTSMPAKTASYPFTIQLACYNSLEGAKERMVLFKEAGLSPYLARSLSRQTGELYWVIYTGYFKTLEEAEQGRKSNKLNDAMVVKTPYATLVGVYSSREEMTEMNSKIERAGLFPYVISDENNVYRLYIGAFSTRQGAENLRKELDSAGIKTTIEER